MSRHIEVGFTQAAILAGTSAAVGGATMTGTAVLGLGSVSLLASGGIGAIAAAVGYISFKVFQELTHNVGEEKRTWKSVLNVTLSLLLFTATSLGVLALVASSCSWPLFGQLALVTLVGSAMTWLPLVVLTSLSSCACNRNGVVASAGSKVPDDL